MLLEQTEFLEIHISSNLLYKHMKVSELFDVAKITSSTQNVRQVGLLRVNYARNCHRGKYVSGKLSRQL